MYYEAVSNMAQSDPDAARSMLDRYGKYMNANSIAALENKLAQSAEEARRKTVDSAAKYTWSAFNLGTPGTDINAAASWITNPDNYKTLGLDDRGAAQAAAGLQAQWNRQRQINKDLHKTTNENFERLAANHQLRPDQFGSWSDPQTGLQPDEGKIRQVEQWMANPPTVSQSDPHTLANLANGISDRRLSDKGPINEAYFEGKLTEADWRKLTDLQTTSTDIAKSRWFNYARDAFNVRYGAGLSPGTGSALPPDRSPGQASAAPEGPNPSGERPNPVTVGQGGDDDLILFPPFLFKGGQGGFYGGGLAALFPRFMMDLDGAIRDQDLKGYQIRELTNKMLDPSKEQLLQKRAEIDAKYGSQFKPRR